MSRILSNLHTHTTFSDGAHSPEEYVKHAIGLGFVSLGISDHAYAWYDTDCCMAQDALPAYLAEISRLKEVYQDQLEIFCGLETDYYGNNVRDQVDYVVGSVHYIKNPDTGKLHCIDYPANAIEIACALLVGGDIRKLVSIYYQTISDMVLTQKPDIVGHMDLLTKYNQGNRYFDPDSDWYLRITAETVAVIKQSGCIVEVNTGGMAKGYTVQPYPGKSLLRQLLEVGVPITISSDAHCIEHLDYGFEMAQKYVSSVTLDTNRPA